MPKWRPTRAKVVKRNALQSHAVNVVEEVGAKRTGGNTRPRLVAKTFGGGASAASTRQMAENPAAQKQAGRQLHGGRRD